MSKLIIMRGLPGSGKSTKAKELSNGIITICSSDGYFEEYDNVTNKLVYIFDQSKLSLYHRLNLEKAITLLLYREISIVDNTNTTFKEMKPYILAAIALDADIELVEPDTEWKFDIEECVKRNTHNVPREAIQRMLSRWEATDLCYQKIEQLKTAINGVK